MPNLGEGRLPEDCWSAKVKIILPHEDRAMLKILTLKKVQHPKEGGINFDKMAGATLRHERGRRTWTTHVQRRKPYKFHLRFSSKGEKKKGAAMTITLSLNGV